MVLVKDAIGKEYRVVYEGTNRSKAVSCYEQADESNTYWDVIYVERLRPVHHEWNDENKDKEQMIYNRKGTDPYDDDTSPYF